MELQCFREMRESTTLRQYQKFAIRNIYNSHRFYNMNSFIPVPLLQRTKSTSWSCNIHEVFALPIGYNPLQSQPKVRKLPQLEVPQGEAYKLKLGSDE